MEILINNKKTQTSASNVDELAIELILPERGVALAINNRVIPRNQWSCTMLSEGDNVTVIKAAFGG